MLHRSAAESIKSFSAMFNNFSTHAFEVVGQTSVPSVIKERIDSLHENLKNLNLESINLVSRALKDLTSYCNLPLNDHIVREMEGIIALLISIFGCRNKTAMISCVLLYARSHFESSITKNLTEYLIESIGFEKQSDDADDPDWLQFIKSVQTNWDICKTNKLFSHLSKVVGLLVTMGMCKATSVTFSVCDYKIFEPDVKIVHGKASDIIDAILSTVTYFVESIYLSIKSGSLKPLLFNNRDSLELDEEFSTVTLWWDLVKNGNLERVANATESEFDRRLERLCTKLKPMASQAYGFEKKLLMDKINRLMRIKNDYVTLKISSGVRKAPFAIELYGESSQGKTTFGDQIIDALLCSADMPLDKEYRASYNPSDKYMSNWATNKSVLIMDDVANDKATFVERPPTRVIIDVCNNQPHYANMADLESKGKVFVEPAIALVNTNVKHLDAWTYSNCPYSIQRRMHVVITVRAKDKYQYIIDGKPQGIDPEKIRREYGDNAPTFDDIWELTVEKAKQPHDITSLASYIPIVWNDVKLEKVPFRVVVQYLIERFREHRADQDCILDRMRSRLKNIAKCNIDGCCQIRGYCDKHAHEKQAGLEFVREAVDSAQLQVQRTTNEILNVYSRWRGMNDIIDRLPDGLFDNYVFNSILFYFMCHRCRHLYYKMSIMNIILLCILSNLSIRVSIIYCVVLQFIIHKLWILYVRRSVSVRNEVHAIIDNLRRNHIRIACKTFGAIGACYCMAKLYRLIIGMSRHGSLEPKTQDDIDGRDGEKSPWTTVFKRSLPVGPKTWTTSVEHLSKNVQKNLVYGTVICNNKRMMVNGLFLRSNIVLIPSHYFEVDVLEVTFRKENPEASGGKFAARLSKSSSYLVPGTDLMLCYCNTGGSFKNLTHYLPCGKMPSMEFSMFWRNKQGEITQFKGLSDPKMTNNGVTWFEGGEYANLSDVTFKGLCGATLVSHGKSNVILGVHLGGRSGTKKGCYGAITQEQMQRGEKHLRSIDGLLLTGTAEQFETQVLSVDVIKEGPIHPKSPLNYMPEDSQVEYYGQCPGKSLMFSSVRVTPISEAVTDVTGMPNKWGPPVMKPDWFGWQECLANLAVPATPYPHDLLEISVKDYKSALIPLFSDKLWNDATPLTYYENTCGIPGKKFMDAIKLNTSIGFPLTGSKRNYIIEEEPDDVWQSKWRFIDEINQEIERCEDCYRRGERAYTIAKACKKDEILSKPKCRIFYGNPIALTFLIRKYYLPILRVLQMNPLVSECAVGINSHGPEWEELHNYVHHFGKDRLIGGDYGKYDQKIPSQLILAALRIMMDFARCCNYTEEDLSVMEAMAGDIVYAVIAYNGDLIGLTEGTHISGNSLTVVINGICGSLNQRAYFYTLFKPKSFEDRLVFRDCVKLMTYGDDNIGSVREGIEEFGIDGLSKFLAQYGQIYTMPDKESELVRFLPPIDFEFLKRKSVYCPKRGCHVGALIDKSIFKMLHCFMREKNSPDSEELASAKNIDTALREWANHGEFLYETRREQMQVIANRTNISHLCTRLDVTYGDVIEEWLDNYSSRGPSLTLIK